MAGLRLLWRLLFLEALFNPTGGQRWGWLWGLKGLVGPRRSRELARQLPEHLNVTPAAAGLLLGLWAGPNPPPPGRVGALASVLSSRSDGLLWGQWRPALLAAALAAGLRFGPAPVLAVPLLWFLVWAAAQLLGHRGARREGEEFLRRVLASPRWKSAAEALEAAGALAVGVAAGLWIRRGGAGPWVLGCLLTGALGGLIFKERLRWWAAFLLVVAWLWSLAPVGGP
jgi:hypothetical protein